MNDKASVAYRLQEAIDLRGIKQADLCKRTGIAKSSISTYLSGEYEPKQRNLYKIAEVLEVNVAWLMGYDVSMTGDDPAPKSPASANGDLTAIREQLRRQPGMRILFDASKGATEQDLLDAANLIEGFKRRRDGEE